MQSHDLKKAGLKATTPRLRILEALREGAPRHLSAEDLYRRLTEAGEDVGLATVYRVLTQFEQAGIVIRHHFASGHSVFELDSGKHHDHMVCLETGRVMEFANEEIERLQREMARRAGYELVDHSLVLYVRPLRED
jgi:Fur family ferric uptake transcriptional regulator